MSTTEKHIFELFKAPHRGQTLGNKKILVVI